MARGGGGSGALVPVVLIAGFIFYGPTAAKKLTGSTSQVLTTVSPVVGGVLAAIAVILLVRHFWSRP